MDGADEALTLDDHYLRRITVGRPLVANGSQRQMILYWFQSRGRFIESEYMQRVYLVLDSIGEKRPSTIRYD